MSNITRASSLAAAVLLLSVSAGHARLAANRLAANRLAANRLAANRLAANRLAANRLASKAFMADPEGVADIIATNDGRELLSFAVSCALPEGTTLHATGSDGTDYEFYGELGLVKSWLRHPLSKAGKGWISACLLARVNDEDVPIPISMRGPNRALATTADETSNYTLEEGAFYGDLFVPEGEPIRWVACRGEDQASGETGGLVNRDCTEPAAADPALTRCGFNYAGDCGAFAPDPACARFSRHGFYLGCQDPTTSAKVRQVITTFVLP